MDNSASVNTSQIHEQDLASFVAGASRFLARLSTMRPFQEANLGLTEWVLLSILAKKNGLTNGQLANALGLSAQRINQVTDSLKAGALISISTAADDARKKTIFISPTGTARLRELNAKLRPIIATALDKRPLALNRTSSFVNNLLMRIVIPPQPARSPSSQVMHGVSSTPRGAFVKSGP